MGLRWKKPTPWSLYKSSDLFWLGVGSAVGLGNFLAIPGLVISSGGVPVILLHLMGLFILGGTLLVGEFLWSRWLMRPYWQSYQVLVPSGSRVSWAVPVFSYLAVLMILPPYLMDMGRLLGLAAGEISRAFFKPVNERTLLEFSYSSSYFRAFFALAVATLCSLYPPRILARLLKILVVGAFLCWVFSAYIILKSFGTVGLERIFYWDNARLDFDAIFKTLGFSLFTLSAGFGVMYHFVFYASQAPLNTNKKEPTDFWKQSGKFMRIAGLIVMTDFLSSLMSLVVASAFASQVETVELIRMFSGDVRVESRTLILDKVPEVLATKPWGSFASISLFMGLFFAGMASALSILDIAIFTLGNELHWSRLRASLHLFGFGALMLTIPLVPTLAQYMRQAGADLLLPLSSLVLCYLVGWKMPRRSQVQILGRGLILDRLFQLWRFWIRYFAPLFLVYYFVSFFNGA